MARIQTPSETPIPAPTATSDEPLDSGLPLNDVEMDVGLIVVIDTGRVGMVSEKASSQQSLPSALQHHSPGGLGQGSTK